MNYTPTRTHIHIFQIEFIYSSHDIFMHKIKKKFNFNFRDKHLKMTVYNLYIFNRDGNCIYYKEWNRTKQSGLSQEQEFQQMFGFIIEMKSFINKMAPGDL